ncbi:DUF2380 domain-containing protein [Candidatus Bathyarchaeota archaeon]|nr:MAG: DUF2380 domain-containing protein [Candidatus Bathyarchaeota archaeon]
MHVDAGPFSGVLTIVYRTASAGPLKWDLQFQSSASADFRLVYTWLNVSDIHSLSSGSSSFSVSYPDANYTFFWGDVPKSLTSSASTILNQFRFSINLGWMSSGAVIRIDPTLVNSGNASFATAYGLQRRVFFEPKGGYYFAFYFDSANETEVYRYSHDGLNWSAKQPLPPRWPAPMGIGCFISHDSCLTTVYSTGQTVLIAAGTRSGPSPYVASLVFSIGNIVGPNITWGNIATAAIFSSTSTNISVRGISSTVSSTGAPVFSFNEEYFDSCPNGNLWGSNLYVVYGNRQPLLVENETSVTARCPTGIAMTVASAVVPSDSLGDARVIFEVSTSSSFNPLRSSWFNGSTNGTVERVDTNVKNFTQFSAVSDAHYVTHAVWLGSNGNVSYAYRSVSDSSWNFARVILKPLPPLTLAYPSLSVDDSTDNLYLFAVENIPNSGSLIMMKTKLPAQSWLDASRTFPVTYRKTMTYLNSNPVSASASGSSQVELLWTEGTYNVTFASIPIQTVWSPYSSPSDPWDGYGLAPFGQYFSNQGEYVSTSIGTLTIRQTDLTVPGRGLNLDITRVYTEPYDFLNGIPYIYESDTWAPMGDGWQLNFPWMNAATSTPGYIHLWDGQAYRIPLSFWNGTTSTFENQQGEHFKLVRNSQFIYLYTKSGTRYIFDAAIHALRGITDVSGNNNVISFSYTNNLLSSITDTVGRVFLFCYSGGLLTSIEQDSGTSGTCGTGFVRRIVYYNSWPDLVRVTDPAGRMTNYTYGSGLSSGVQSWLITRVTYPTGWYTNYTYAHGLIGTQADSYRVTKQYLASGSAPVREFLYAYTNGIGDEVANSTVSTLDGASGSLQPVSYTDYAFSFAGVSWNVSDAHYSFLRGTVQRFGVSGEVPREITLVSPTQGYTNYYRYDLWGNLVYSRRVINPSAGWYHETFSDYYNGLPLGFSSFQESFSQNNYTATDNVWQVYNGTWLVQNGVYNGTSPVFNPTVQEGFFAWTNTTSPNVSVTASISIAKSMASSNQDVGLIAHYPGNGLRRWALVLHNSTSGFKLSLRDEEISWVAESPCTISYNTWYQLNFTIIGRQAWGSATAPGISCYVSGTFSSTDVTSASGFGLYAGGYSALFDNVTLTTAVPGIMGTSFSNSFLQNGAPDPTIHAALAGLAQLQNGTGSAPVESYYGYYSTGGLNQVRQRYNSLGGMQWLTSSRTYDTHGSLASLLDTAGNYTYFTYSNSYQNAFLTNETQVLRPGGNRITQLYSYNFTTGTMLSSLDPKGYNTAYQYDILGRTTRVTLSTNDYTVYTYNDNANFVDVTNENGWKTREVYDGLARVTVTDHFLNGVSYSNETFQYDSQNNVLTRTDATGNIYRFQYDGLGRLVNSTAPNGKSTMRAYNDASSWVRSSDQDGKITCQTYDRLGRTLSVVENASSDCLTGIVTNYGYDEVGDLVRVTSPNQELTTYSYDNLGRLTQTNYADGTSESYGYDVNSNPVLKVDRNGVRTTRGYDSLSRISTINYQGNPATSDNYTYDNNGNLLKLKSQNATLTYNYDSRNRITGETYSVNGGFVGGPLAGPHGPSVPSGTFSSGYSFTYAYSGETLSQITYNDFMTAGYTYDGLGRTASVRIGTPTSHPNATTFSYYPNDQMKGTSYGNGLVANYTYDSVSRPVQLTVKNSTSTLLSLTYTYNNTGTISTVNGQVNGASINEQYGYDSLKRLTNSVLVKSSTTTLSYVYDNVGNRLSQTTNGASTINYSYNPSNNELTSSTFLSSHYSYYPNGSLKQWNYTFSGSHSNSYSWDVPGNLVKFFQNGSLQAAYAYDGLGRRVESEEGSTVTFYSYTGTETLADFATSGAENNYIYANGLRIARVYGAAGITPTIVYYHEDALGSTRLVTSSTKTVLFSDSYQPYGLDNGASGSETYKFTGKPFSTTTGLYYEYSRWYDPSIGRFISEDPSAGRLSDPQSLNAYVYVGNLPTVRTDPTGAAWCPGGDTCEGGYNLLNDQPYSQEQIDSIQDPHIREMCADNPLFCRGMGYIQDDQSGGSLPTTGDTSSPGGPGSDGSLGSGEPATITVTVSDGTQVIDTSGTPVSTASSGSNGFIDSVVQENGGYTGEFQEHHLLPHEFDKPYFEPKGLEVDDYTMRVDANLHRIIHGKGIGYENSWNYKWGQFIARNPNASPEDIMSYAYQLGYEFGLLW